MTECTDSTFRRFTTLVFWVLPLEIMSVDVKRGLEEEFVETLVISGPLPGFPLISTVPIEDRPTEVPPSAATTDSGLEGVDRVGHEIGFVGIGLVAAFERALVLGLDRRGTIVEPLPFEGWLTERN